MILFYGEGRLGNQVFQYQALSHIARPGERILAVGLEELERQFDLQGPRLVVLTRSRTWKRAVKYLVRPVLWRLLARKLRLTNYASETSFGAPPLVGAGGHFALRRGLLRHITLVDGGHYQNPSVWPTLFPVRSMQVKPALRSEARRILASLGRRELRPVFVHVRRGDYLTHRDYGLCDLALPPDFYRAAIAELERRVAQTQLVFVTDDPAWVNDHFADLDGKVTVSKDAGLDFAIMTECAGGILSNSTFSLAAALMLRDPEAVIGPEFWLGFRVGQWLPPHIQVHHPRVHYIAALPSAVARGRWAAPSPPSPAISSAVAAALRRAT